MSAYTTRLRLADPAGYRRQMHVGFIILPLITPPVIEAITVLPWGKYPGWWHHSYDARQPAYREPNAPRLSMAGLDPIIYATKQEAIEAVLIELRAQIARKQGYVDRLLDCLVEWDG